MHTRWSLLLATLTICLGGCSYGVGVDAYPTMPNTAKDCDALYADLPQSVADQGRRDVKDTVAAVWGDPPIILRCGVEKPARLDRVSQCFVIDDVGWFQESTSDGWLFSTIGREYFLSVEIPARYEPAADALVDLAKSVKKHDPLVKPCV